MNQDQSDTQQKILLELKAIRSILIQIANNTNKNNTVIFESTPGVKTVLDFCPHGMRWDECPGCLLERIIR